MLSLFALALVRTATIPSGAYAMPEFCRTLSKAIGAQHAVDANLIDYPIFVSVKDGDPKRARDLVASALHAKWMTADGQYRLVAIKPTPWEGLQDFEQRFRIAAAGTAAANLPAKDLYQLNPGEIVRYGAQVSAFVRQLPPGSKDQTVLVRRFVSGAFELSTGGDLNLMSVPDSVRTGLKGELAKSILDQDALTKIKDGMRDPTALKGEFKDLKKSDPVAVLSEPLMKAVARALQRDIAVALPDFSLFAVMYAANGHGTLEEILKAYAMVVDWELGEGALLGRLPACERRTPTQSRRQVLARLIQAMGSQGVANSNEIAAYVANQRPFASDSWCDAMLLSMSGKVIDSEFIGDYPHNMRLYAAFDGRDWNLIKSGTPFQAAQLSPKAQSLLGTLLLQSRTCMRPEPETGDPANWPSLRPADLIVTSELADEQVLLAFTGIGADVQSVRDAAANYDMRKREMKREPLYQPASRRKLKLSITCMASGQSAKTGFSEATPLPGTKPVVWSELPDDVVATWKQTIKEYEKLRIGKDGGS